MKEEHLSNEKNEEKIEPPVSTIYDGFVTLGFFVSFGLVYIYLSGWTFYIGIVVLGLVPVFVLDELQISRFKALPLVLGIYYLGLVLFIGLSMISYGLSELRTTFL